MVDWAVAEFEKIHGAGRANKLKSNARAIRRLRTACENAKRSVSSAPTTTLEVRTPALVLVLLSSGTGLHCSRYMREWHFPAPYTAVLDQGRSGFGSR